MTSWREDRLPVERIERMTVPELHERWADGDDGLQVLDVRERDEWDDGHIPGSVFEPYHDIDAIPDGIDPARPVAVICGSGQRSAVAASLLQRFGAERRRSTSSTAACRSGSAAAGRSRAERRCCSPIPFGLAIGLAVGMLGGGGGGAGGPGARLPARPARHRGDDDVAGRRRGGGARRRARARARGARLLAPRRLVHRRRGARDRRRHARGRRASARGVLLVAFAPVLLGRRVRDVAQGRASDSEDGWEPGAARMPAAAPAARPRRRRGGRLRHRLLRRRRRLPHRPDARRRARVHDAHGDRHVARDHHGDVAARRSPCTCRRAASSTRRDRGDRRAPARSAPLAGVAVAGRVPQQALGRGFAVDRQRASPSTWSCRWRSSAARQARRSGLDTRPVPCGTRAVLNGTGPGVASPHALGTQHRRPRSRACHGRVHPQRSRPGPPARARLRNPTTDPDAGRAADGAAIAGRFAGLPDHSEAMVAADTDASSTSTRATPTARCGCLPTGPRSRPAIDAEFAGASDDGSRVFFVTAENLDAFGDTDTTDDIYVRNANGTLDLVRTSRHGPGREQGGEIHRRIAPTAAGSSSSPTRRWRRTTPTARTTFTHVSRTAALTPRLRRHGESRSEHPGSEPAVSAGRHARVLGPPWRTSPRSATPTRATTCTRATPPAA